MKKMLLFALVIMASLFTGCKQRIEQAPEEVLSAFGTMFPGASHVEWAEQLCVYMADIYHDGHEKQAQFDSTGTLLRTRTELSIYEVPAQVLKTAREFSDWEIDDVFLFEQSYGAASYYMVEYKQGTPFSTKQLHILTDGTILAAL